MTRLQVKCTLKTNFLITISDITSVLGQQITTGILYTKSLICKQYVMILNLG